MQIVGLDIWIVTIPYPAPISWAGVVEAEAQSLLLRIRTDSETHGLAQAKIHPAWSGTSPRLTAHALTELYEPILRGLDPIAPERTREAMDRVRGWSAAKALLDNALTDIRSRHAGLSLRKYLGGWTDEAPVSGLIARGPREQRVEELARSMERHGFTAFKVKIGTDPREDVALLQNIREVSDSILLRVDANSGYNVRDALFVGDALAELDVLHFEDPCPLEAPPVRRELFRRSRVRVLVDRAIDSPRSARQVIDEGAHAVSVKVQRVGFRIARQIIEICEDEDVPAVAGLNAEAAIGALASLQMYAAYRHFDGVPAEESFFASLPHDIVAAPPEVHDGKIVLPDSPGLGVDLDEEALARFGVRYQVI